MGCGIAKKEETFPVIGLRGNGTTAAGTSLENKGTRASTEHSYLGFLEISE
jgi:hypothetical protein